MNHTISKLMFLNGLFLASSHFFLAYGGDRIPNPDPDLERIYQARIMRQSTVFTCAEATREVVEGTGRAVGGGIEATGKAVESTGRAVSGGIEATGNLLDKILGGVGRVVESTGKAASDVGGGVEKAANGTAKIIAATEEVKVTVGIDSTSVTVKGK